MKIIFLDIDGVLATEESSKMLWHEEFAYPFDTACVAIFNRILENTSAEIVLTSDWRIGFDNDLNALDLLFKHNKVNKSPIDLTPDFGKNRNKEILSYVNKFSNKISSFVILDDIGLKVHSLRFIRTNITEALKQTGIEEKVIAVLNSNQNEIQTCINCEAEYKVTIDHYCCSVECRSEIEQIKVKDQNGITDSEIKEYFIFKRVSDF